MFEKKDAAENNELMGLLHLRAFFNKTMKAEFV
jgi:hypothetical protein